MAQMRQGPSLNYFNKGLEPTRIQDWKLFEYCFHTGILVFIYFFKAGPYLRIDPISNHYMAQH